MWEGIFTLLFLVLKWVAEAAQNKKLNDKDFLNYIEAHQKRRAGVSRQSQDFEDNLAQGYEELVKEGAENEKTLEKN